MTAPAAAWLCLTVLVLGAGTARAADQGAFTRKIPPALSGTLDAYKARRAMEAEAAWAEERQRAAAEAEAKRQILAASCPAPPLALQPAVAPGPPGSVFRDCPHCPEMVVLPAGDFMMGGHEYNDERPVRHVTFRYGFAVGRFEVTQAEWRAVMGDNPSTFKGERHPVEQVSWEDVQDFIRCLNAGLSPETPGYRLLSEAEWEYAARAGAATAYHWGDSVGAGNANCDRCGGPKAGSHRGTTPVGSFPPNAFGLYDMLGNVAEWTQDCYAYGYGGASADGVARMGLATCYRVNRGGSWYDHPRDIRSAYRNGDIPNYRNDNLGFRLARTLGLR